MKIEMICSGIQYSPRPDLGGRCSIQFQSTDNNSSLSLLVPMDHGYTPGTRYTLELTPVAK